MTNEMPSGRRLGSRHSKFPFDFSDFAIRTQDNHVEFDSLVTIFAAEYIANGLTGAGIYTKICRPNGKVVVFFLPLRISSSFS
jgi:hypothetical protein